MVWNNGSNKSKQTHRKKRGIASYQSDADSSSHINAFTLSSPLTSGKLTLGAIGSSTGDPKQLTPYYDIENEKIIIDSTDGFAHIVVSCRANTGDTRHTFTCALILDDPDNTVLSQKVAITPDDATVDRLYAFDFSLPLDKATATHGMIIGIGNADSSNGITLYEQRIGIIEVSTSRNKHRYTPDSRGLIP